MIPRFVLIGDVHTEHERLERVLDHAARVGARPLCVGDVIDGPGDPLRCVDLLRAHAVDTVRGNHERWLGEGRPLDPFEYSADALAWLAALPRVRTYDTPMGTLMLGHGIADDDMARLQPHDEGYALETNDALWALVKDRRCDVFVGGHTHRRMIRRFEHLLILNPGTLLRHHEPCCMDVDFERRIATTYDVSASSLTLADESPLP